MTPYQKACVTIIFRDPVFTEEMKWACVKVHREGRLRGASLEEIKAYVEKVSD